MSVKKQDVYQASFDTVYQLLTNEEFLYKKYESVGSRNLVFQECKQDGDVFRIRWTREVPAEIPSFAKSFLSPWNTLIEEMEWRDEAGGKEGLYEGKIMGIGGLTIMLNGEFYLKPNGSGCVENIEMLATVSMPLVGGKIKELVENDAIKNLTKEYEFTRKHLGES